MTAIKTIQTDDLAMDVLWEASPPPSLEGALQGMLQGLGDNVFSLLGKGPWALEFALHLVEDEKMLQLNREHRGQATTTDVLSFPVHENLREQMLDALPLIELGDVVISLPRAGEQSSQHNISLSQEVAHLLAHGFLHLLGFDHKMESEASTMFALEDRLVKSIYQKCHWEH